MKITESTKREMVNNLYKGLELLNSVFLLKLSLYKKLYPDKSEKEISNIIYQEIIDRKEQQWKSQ